MFVHVDAVLGTLLHAPGSEPCLQDRYFRLEIPTRQPYFGVIAAPFLDYFCSIDGRRRSASDPGVHRQAQHSTANGTKKHEIVLELKMCTKLRHFEPRFRNPNPINIRFGQ